jgi:hypothetical protein
LVWDPQGGSSLCQTRQQVAYPPPGDAVAGFQDHHFGATELGAYSYARLCRTLTRAALRAGNTEAAAEMSKMAANQIATARKS